MADAGVYKFTSQVQLKILTLLWRDEQSYNVYRETIKPKYFSQSIHIDLCRIIFDYHEKYGKSPTLDVLVEEVTQMCEKTKNKKKLEDDYLECVLQMSDIEMDDIEYIKDKILSFGKRQALVDAVLESAEILEKKPDTEYPQIEGLVKDALLVGEDVNDLGVDIYENIEERFISYMNDDDVIERIPTGMEMLDSCLGGGVGRTEMCVVIAPPGKGKTTMLISMGAAALEEGYNVLHISLENNEKQITRNYDLRLLKKNMDYVRDNLDKSIAAMFNIKKYRKGRLKIKKYPTKGATVNTIRGLLDQLKVVEKFVPDVVIVDYGMIVKPAREYAEKRSGIEGIYEDLRALADEYNCALYTAAQGNRASLSKKIVTTQDIAECFAIANIADIAIALCQTAKEKLQGIMRGFLAKNRDNADGIILKGQILYEIKKIEFSEVVEQSADDSEEDEEEDNWEE